jgi:tRNASer (uridine44-2'-O)-methyltransferase
MASTVIHHGDDAEPKFLEQLGKVVSPKWRPIVSQECGFDTSSFVDVMMNLVKNPNITSSWLFRADILEASLDRHQAPAHPSFHNLVCKDVLVRRLIPRNPKRDEPLDQTCLFYESSESTDGPSQSLVVYLPHVASVSEMPFYHPKVRAVGFLHEWAAAQKLGSLSIHYLYFDEEIDRERLRRTALSLLTVIHKHGQGRKDGYTKRVNHDIVVPQPAFQDRYTMVSRHFL